MKKIFYKEVKIKEMIANPAIQNALKELVEVPRKVLIKQVKNAFENKDTKETTQKVHAVAGRTLTDMMELDLVLSNCTIDGTKAINKEYEILEYSFGLDANMRGGSFNGYSATGLRIIVTKIEEVKVGESK